MFQLLEFILNIFTFFTPLILTIKILDQSITFKYSCYQFVINYWLYYIVLQYLQYNIFMDNLLFLYVSKFIKFWLFYGKSNNLKLSNHFLLLRFLNLNLVQLFEVNYLNPLINKINPGFKEINYQIYLSGKIYLLPINYNQPLFRFLNNFIAMFQLPTNPLISSKSKSKSRQTSSSTTTSTTSKLVKKLRKPKRVNSGDSSHSETRSRSASRSRSRSSSTSTNIQQPNISSNQTSPTLSPIDYQIISDQLPSAQPNLLSIPKYKRTISPPPYEEIIQNSQLINNYNNNSPEISLSDNNNSRHSSRSVSRKSSFSSSRSRPVSINGSSSGNNSSNSNNNNNVINLESIDSTIMTNNNSSTSIGSGNSNSFTDIRIGSESMNRIQEQLNNTRSNINNDLPPLPTPRMMNR